LEQFEKLLREQFRLWSNHEADNIEYLPLSGSSRCYIRLSGAFKSAIGAYNKDFKENRAFIEFTKHFRYKKLPVPDIFESDLDKNIYLLEDLGDETLYSFLIKNRTNRNFPENAKQYYKKVVVLLPHFQIEGNKGLNYDYCYPRNKFDKQSMMWDLDYFKYYFLKLAQIPFDEQSLEDDFDTLTAYLLKADSDYFMYRDFQSRNIMLYKNEPYFIDYQGGRKGALQYDIASLLYDAKADLPQEIRIELLNDYIDELEKIIPINRKEFELYYYGFVFIRIMQALGAYGFRGFYENKTHFLQSIPFALKNIEWLLKNDKLPLKLNTLSVILKELTINERLMKIAVTPSTLTVSVNSFSYKKGLPTDDSGNGGGFIFDCRALPNPGRYNEYKDKTGMDSEVVNFLKDKNEVDDFLNNVYGLIDISLQNYIERGFTSLQINFGCTGGQHRSVFFAEKASRYIKAKYNVNVVLYHREQDYKEIFA